jgi:hypothetical protein
VVLNPKKFRPFETRILFGIALLLIGVGIFGLVIATQRLDWRLALASAGVLVLGTVYFYAVEARQTLVRLTVPTRASSEGAGSI